MTAPALSSLINQLPGPILVIGASGFIGANLLHALLAERDDVTGTFFSGISWRLRALSALRARVEHVFRVLKRQFGYIKARYRGIAKNAAQIVTLLALSNLWQARRRLLPQTGEMRL